MTPQSQLEAVEKLLDLIETAHEHGNEEAIAEQATKVRASLAHSPAASDYTRAEDVQIGDIVRPKGTGIGGERLRVTAVYDGADEIVVETTGCDWSGVGDAYDICWFDVEFVERPSLAPKLSDPGLREAVKVQRIETVDGDCMTEEGEPFWRIEINGYCADFDYEEAANNFADAIRALSVPVRGEG